jgi:tRNA (cytidine/uridine-2'-O-)-methyltransferase
MPSPVKRCKPLPPFVFCLTDDCDNRASYALRIKIAAVSGDFAPRSERNKKTACCFHPKNYEGHMLNLVLYQPDIPQNLGAMLRLSACLGSTIHVVEPCGFPLNDQKLKRAGMDYIQLANLVKHMNWSTFLEYKTQHEGRMFLLETDGDTTYTDITYLPTDYIVLGRESAGTPRALYAQMEKVIVIPMREGVRSLNVAMSAGMIAAEACRQLAWKF